jgi:hypothetical protein
MMVLDDPRGEAQLKSRLLGGNLLSPRGEALSVEFETYSG